MWIRPAPDLGLEGIGKNFTKSSFSHYLAGFAHYGRAFLSKRRGF
jgi:hypothetical protein